MQDIDLIKVHEYIAKRLQIKKDRIVLTGSLSLSILGLLEREIKDIDFVIECNSYEDALNLSRKMSNNKGSRALSYTFAKRGLNIDLFFIVGDIEKIKANFEGIRLINPITLLKIKRLQGCTKSNQDILKIIESIFTN